MPIYAGAAGVTGFVRLELKVYDLAGALADPDDVSVTILLPDGTTSDESGNAVRESTGVYYLDYEPALVGNYGVYWVTTGVNAGTLEDAFNVEDLTIAAPVSLSEVKDHLNMAPTRLESDDELRAFINSATAAIEARVGPLTRRQVTETHNGGVSGILLNSPPALSVTSVTENGTTVSPSGYRLSPGGGVLTRVNGYTKSVWTDGFANVTVTFTAGRTSIPADIRQAVLELVRHLWTTQRGQQGNRRQDEFIAGQGYTMPNRVLELIAPYELPGIA
jgi:hypothetical protein